MTRHACTDKQLLLVNKNKGQRNYTIDVSIKLKDKLDHQLLIDSFNEEIKRNEGLRLRVFKKFFTWYNEIKEVYTIDSINLCDLKGKTNKEVEEFIDGLCVDKIDLLKASRPYEIYHIVSDEYDYILLRVLHSNMDAYSVLLTLKDIVKIYTSKRNNTEYENQLSSVEEYFVKYDELAKTLKPKMEEDNNYFINKNKEFGKARYMTCGENLNIKDGRLKLDMINDHPASYYQKALDKNTSEKIKAFCEKNQVNITAAFVSAINIAYSAFNNHNDMTMICSTNLRAKQKEKQMPFTTATGLFFRRKFDTNVSYVDFNKVCSNEYMIGMKHHYMDCVKIYIQLMNNNVLNVSTSRYDEVAFGFIPVDLSDIEIQSELYMPKAKTAADNVIYIIVSPNNNGEFEFSYRYYSDILNEENIKKLHNAIETILINGLDNENMNVNEIINKI